MMLVNGARRRPPLASLAFLCALAGASGALAQHHGLDPETFFRKRCARCHTVPDARFPLDAAWLTQTLETS